MKQYEPIPVRPMRLRGVFGITWNLYKRGFCGMFFYCLLFLGVFMLISSLLSFGSMTNMMQFGEGIDVGNNTFYHSFEGLGETIGALFLSLLLSLINMMVLQPILQGGMYTEVSCHVYGNASGFGGMMRRCRYMLKRFFSTQMTLWLVSVGFSFVFFVLFFIVIMVTMFGMIPSLLFSDGEPGIGMYVTLVAVMLVLFLIFFVAMLFLSFLYPVAVNEGVYNFKALGRSFKLVAKRFWRVLGMNLLAFLVLAIVIFALMLGYALLPTDNYHNEIVAMLLYTMIIILVEVFFLPYQVSLSTALYFDARARFPEQPEPVSQQGTVPGAGFQPPGEEPCVPCPDERVEEQP